MHLPGGKKQKETLVLTSQEVGFEAGFYFCKDKRKKKKKRVLFVKNMEFGEISLMLRLKPIFTQLC